MIKIIIIEDEIAGQELLKKNILENFPECKIMAIEEHVDLAIKKIEQFKPDLVFLDINIKGGTGFDVLSHFDTRNFEVIFVTAYDSYAIQAIRESAIDYILKPINVKDFINGVSRALESIKNTSNSSSFKSIPIPTSSGSDFINIEDIIFLEAEGAYTYIYTGDKKSLSTKAIGEYETILNKKIFFRTHHSFIINMYKIEKFDKGRSGKLIMISGHSIPVSQRKMKDFTVLLNKK